MNIIENIKSLRKKAGLTQNATSEKLNMAQQNYNLLENGKTEITLSRLEKLAEIFGVSVGELLGLEAVGKAGEVAEVEALRQENEKLRKERDMFMQIIENQAKALGALALEEMTSPEAKEKFREQIKKNAKNSTQTEANTDYMAYDYGLPPED